MATRILVNNNNKNEAFLAIKSPNEVFRAILEQLNEWISFIPNLFHSLVAKFDEAFPPKKRAQWAAAAAKWAAVAAGVVVLCLFCFCFFSVIIGCFSFIISCIVFVVVAICKLISLVFVFLWRVFRAVFVFLWRVFQGLCCCGRRSLGLMKAPGTGGRLFIPRADFESNPASYFRGLRARSIVYVN